MAITDPGPFSGAASGAAAGSMFGPVGAVVGGAVGLVTGLSNSGAQRKALKKATKQSYSYSDESASFVRKGRQQVMEGYEQDMGTTTAQFAASGARLEGKAWDQAVGANARRRDEGLLIYQQEEDAWRKSDAFELIQKDYRRMTGVTERYERPNNRHKGDLILGVKGRGRSGEILGGKYERVKLNGNSAKKREAYAKYVAMATPTFQQYEKNRFGSEEDKATYGIAMDQRSEKAADWLRGQMAAIAADELRQVRDANHR